MNNITLRDKNGDKWQRITKTAARKAYDAGENIIISAVNIDPFGIMGGVETSKDHAGETFDKLVNAFEYYNCGLRECGYYAAFYKKEV